ncbi:amino acid racemase [Olsenella sp. YH-ols2217]|uniref:Amino acid racemase n=1 Tax=Kribbibacterium absianum TaxID=3044210 RepID=A0ABT6ZIB5_9ACTN|nr:MULTISPECIES: amino acid racemase [unclassified Olsenella]MDJ1121295.1 amino acid racemase [Olsenella sp. YH-ols2216]MDJ1128785.1 amino acid racemase [Olsenella sp. YH-ols2217]
MNKPVLGVLGGVGPMATAAFMEAVISRTPAQCDQDNIPMIVFNDPQIPDRTAFILDPSEPDPLPEMVKVARWLEDAGADYIAIPCNTAHYFHDAIAAAVEVPVLNIMELTARRVAALAGPGARVGLMATEGTTQSGVFQGYFEQAGLETVVPSEEERAIVTSLIYDTVKRNRPFDPDVMLGVAERLRGQGCDAVVLGCTELSVIYATLDDAPTWLVDAMDVLADACVEAYERTRAKAGPVEM